MPCEHYQIALTETLAAGRELEADLRFHLEACAVCREFFAQEQTLFAAIDSRVQQAVDADAPPSLLPRVRARLAEVPASPRRSWTPAFAFGMALSAVLLAIFVARRPGHDADREHSPQITSTTPDRTPQKPSVLNESHSSAPVLVSAPRHPGHLSEKTRQARNIQPNEPEVLVPPEEREALARFVAAVEQRNEIARALVTRAPDADNKALKIEPLQIAQLELKPLGAEEVESNDRAEQSR